MKPPDENGAHPPATPSASTQAQPANAEVVALLKIIADRLDETNDLLTNINGEVSSISTRVP